MDFNSLLRLWTIMNENGLLQIPVLVVVWLGYRRLKIFLNRLRYTELSVTAMNYAIEKSVGNGFAAKRDEMLEHLLEKEKFITEKK